MAEGKCGLDADGVWRFVVHAAAAVQVVELVELVVVNHFPSPSMRELAPITPPLLCAAELPQALTILCSAPTFSRAPPPN